MGGEYYIYVAVLDRCKLNLRNESRLTKCLKSMNADKYYYVKKIYCALK